MFTKRHSRAIPLIIAVFVVLLGCAGNDEHRSTGQVVDDSGIAGKIKAALIQNKDTKARDINVEVYRGEVQLAGFVDSEQESIAAANLARNVDGVTRVNNNLQVKSANSADQTTGQIVDDGVITSKVKAALIKDERTNAYQINVETHQGEVQLAGFVDSMTAKSTAADLAAAVAGVTNVRNDLEVK